ncbi:short-chain dehydrogenase TIC 32 B, chloroplastic [Nymphaea colorata]|nr:short-chain dehydrogenase TIC 32 B, chloroplastic [Nymphaea colorata]
MKETLKYLLGTAGPSGFGSNSTAEQVTEKCCLFPNQLTAIITGATSGIGAETARVLAKRGLRIVIPARNVKSASEMKARIQKENPEVEIIVMELDLGSFASIRRFCSAFLSSGLPLNILINNAGKYCRKLQFTEDNFEMCFATNYLGHFLLTEMLVGRMMETAAETGVEGRIINVSSVIHSWAKREGFNLHDMLTPRSYNGTRAYAQSKLANILHAKELARLLKANNARVTVNSVHPGIVKTGIIREEKGLVTDVLYLLAGKLLKTTSQAASTTCYVALDPSIKGVSGKFFADCNESPCSSLADDQSEATKLWRQTHEMIRRKCSQDGS